MRLRWTPWLLAALAGVVAGFAGVALSYAAAMLLTMGDAPVVAVADLVIRLTPGFVTERAIAVLGQADKPVLVAMVILGGLLLSAVAGMLARWRWWAAVATWVALAGIGTVAVLVQRGAGPGDLVPVVVGLITWLGTHLALTRPLRNGDESSGPDVRGGRRAFALGAVGVVVLATAGGVMGRVVASGRRRVETSRSLLRIDGVTRRQPPDNTSLGLPGVTPWQTPSDRFYVIDTVITVPAIEPDDWSLRVHGMVDRELTLSFADLVSRTITESWVTLSCVSNPVGGDLVGNARWSGVRIADVLREAGVHSDADCVRQVSHDGWDCATPLAALTDGRAAMLAVAMNGRPLPLEHGFPVRTVVPGLYGFVSATKWVVELEVTRFDRVETFWTQKGWAEQGPVKTSSRIDVPRAGAEVSAGSVSVGGVAWHPNRGVASVEVSLDGGEWRSAQLGGVPSNDTWVQWALTLDVAPGDHTLRVRATDRTGETQTSVRRDVVPDGATGWHAVEFAAR